MSNISIAKFISICIRNNGSYNQQQCNLELSDVNTKNFSFNILSNCHQNKLLIKGKGIKKWRQGAGVSAEHCGSTVRL